MESINTEISPYSFEDEIVKYLEKLVPNSGVMYRESIGEYEIEHEDGEKFDVQVCAVADIPDDTLQGGLYCVNQPAPAVEVDGIEYRIMRQW